VFTSSEPAPWFTCGRRETAYPISFYDLPGGELISGHERIATLKAVRLHSWRQTLRYDDSDPTAHQVVVFLFIGTWSTCHNAAS
jgi:hypothetical protein